MSDSSDLSIYDYLSYRDYIRDYLKMKKEQNPHYSQRVLLRKMDISSSGFIANVIAGRSNFTVEQATLFTKIVQFNVRETKYFKLLLYFAKAKNSAEKNDFFQQILSYRKLHFKKLSRDELSLFKKWYYVVIRELLNFYEFSDDYEALAQQVEPSISVGEAKNAIAELEYMGLIKKDEKGIYRQSEAALSTGDEVQSLYVANYQRDMFDLGKASLETVEAAERDLSGLTITVSDEKFSLIKDEIQNFRKRVLQIAIDDDNPNRVMRCNFQIFPVTKKVENNE